VRLRDLWLLQLYSFHSPQRGRYYRDTVKRQRYTRVEVKRHRLNSLKYSDLAAFCCDRFFSKLWIELRQGIHCKLHNVARELACLADVVEGFKLARIPQQVLARNALS